MIQLPAKSLSFTALDCCARAGVGRTTGKNALPHISAATAKTHVSRLLTKLNARDRAQLVVIAYESGLVTPGTP